MRRFLVLIAAGGLAALAIWNWNSQRQEELTQSESVNEAAEAVEDDADETKDETAKPEVAEIENKTEDKTEPEAEQLAEPAKIPEPETPEEAEAAEIGAPVLTVDPAKVDFGEQTLGTRSDGRTVTLQNTGSEELAINSIVVEGDFYYSSGCGTTLGPGATCLVTLSFQPYALGERHGSASVHTDALVSPTVIELIGNGSSTPLTTSSDTNNDDHLSFKQGSYKVAEGQTLTVRVVRTGAATGSASVDYAIVDGTAAEDLDFMVTNGSLIFAPGVTEQTFSVVTYDDADVEGDETATLTLGNAVGATVSYPNAGLTVTDDDVAN